MLPLTRFPPLARLSHVGRSTGRRYHIPVNAFRHEDGFVFALTYGAGTDWVKNVFASGEATIEYRGQTHQLTNPGLIDRRDARPALPLVIRVLLRLIRVNEYLRMRIAE